MGIGLAINNAGAVVLELRGLSPMTDALPALWLAVNGVIAASLMFLTFVPPARYLAWVRQRHAGRTGNLC